MEINTKQELFASGKLSASAVEIDVLELVSHNVQASLGNLEKVIFEKE